MSNVVQFPARESIAVVDGTDPSTGRKVYLLEYVRGDTCSFVAEYPSLVDLAYGILEWEVDGVPVIDPPRGAA